MPDSLPSPGPTHAWRSARTRARVGSDPRVPSIAEATPGVNATATGHELIVDLPEGQKVILGRLPAGTVVEIASWRGTGAPDSRTSRLLLGTASALTSAGSMPRASGSPSDAARGGRSRPDADPAARTKPSMVARVALITICAVAVATLGLVLYTAVFT